MCLKMHSLYKGWPNRIYRVTSTAVYVTVYLLLGHFVENLLSYSYQLNENSFVFKILKCSFAHTLSIRL